MRQSDAALLDRIISDTEAQLEAARQRLRALESARDVLRSLVSSASSPSGSGPVFHPVGGSELLTDYALAMPLWHSLEAALDQVDACVILAEANAGYLYLGDVLSMMRCSGKTRVDSDRNLKRNLDTKLKASGRFTCLGRYRYYLKGWEPEDAVDPLSPLVAASP